MSSVSSIKAQLRARCIPFDSHATKSQLEQLLSTGVQEEKKISFSYKPLILDFGTKSFQEIKLELIRTKNRDGVKILILKGYQPNATRYTDHWTGDHDFPLGSIDIFELFPNLESIDIACDYINDASFHTLRFGYPTLKKVRFSGKYMSYITVETLESLSACWETLEYFENGNQEFESHEWKVLLSCFKRGTLKGYRFRSSKNGYEVVS